MGLPARRGHDVSFTVLMVAALSLGCASTGGSQASTGAEAAPAAVAPQIARTYRVGPSDQLSIRVLPDPAVERIAKVRPDGRFSMDLIGDVDAAGRTTDEIAAEIKQRMAAYRQSPAVTVSLELPASTAVTVLGEVGRPSVFPLERETRLSEAIALAGGPTLLAATSRIRVIRRDGEQTVRYDVNLDRTQRGETGTDLLVAKGDLIYVPAATPVVAGYKLERALYPLRVVMRTIAGPVIGFVAGGN